MGCKKGCGGSSGGCKKCFCTILRCMLKCCEPTPPGECETAYAKGGPPLETCFTDLGFGNWGWTNGPIGPGFTGTWPVWAGAAQCDTSKGHLAGHVVVAHDGQNVTIRFQAEEGCCITEQQVYIGADQLPTGPGGQPTVSPGQYPFKQDFDGCVTESLMSEPFTGPVFVIFHVVACCEPATKEQV